MADEVKNEQRRNNLVWQCSKLGISYSPFLMRLKRGELPLLASLLGPPVGHGQRYRLETRTEARAHLEKARAVAFRLHIGGSAALRLLELFDATIDGRKVTFTRRNPT